MGKLINDTIQIFNKVVKGALITIGNTCTVIGDSNNQAKEFIKPNGEYTLNWNDIGSNAYLEIPDGSVIKYAVLEWHSSIANSELNGVMNNHYAPVKFTTPNSTHELKIDSDSSNQAEYTESLTEVQSVKWIDVTDILRESSNGYYTLEKIPVAPLSNLKNNNLRAGWSLSVVYENQNMPNRNICINIGIKKQDFKTPREIRTLEIKGFRVPSFPRKSYITIVASNGSPNFYTSLNIYDNKSVTNNMTLEYSVGNFVECRFLNPNSIPIVPHDNVFSGIIMNTNTESSDYGRLDTKGTLGNKNNEAFNTLNQPLYKGNRAKLDILSFDISEKMHPNQENLFVISEIWNPSKIVSIDIILYALQIDTDEPITDELKHNYNQMNNLEDIEDIFNPNTYEFKEKTNLIDDYNFKNNEPSDFDDYLKNEEDNIAEVIEEIFENNISEEIEGLFEEPNNDFSYEENSSYENISESVEDIFENNQSNEVEDTFNSNESEMIEEIEDNFEGFNENSNLNNLEDNLSSDIAKSFEDTFNNNKVELIEEIEDNFEELNNNLNYEENSVDPNILEPIEDIFENNQNKTIKELENIFENNKIRELEDTFKHNQIEEIEDNFEGFNENSNLNNLEDNLNSNIAKSFEDTFNNNENKLIEEIEDNFEEAIHNFNLNYEEDSLDPNIVEPFEDVFENNPSDVIKELEDGFKDNKIQEIQEFEDIFENNVENNKIQEPENMFKHNQDEEFNENLERFNDNSNSNNLDNNLNHNVVEKDFERFNDNSKLNRLEDNLNSDIAKSFEDIFSNNETELAEEFEDNFEEIEDVFEGFDNVYDPNYEKSNLVDSNENVFDKEEVDKLEEIEDVFEGFDNTYNTNLNEDNLKNISNTIEDSFKDNIVEDLKYVSNNEKGGEFDMTSKSFENAFEKDEKNEFEEIEDVFDKSKNHFNVISDDNLKNDFDYESNLKFTEDSSQENISENKTLSNNFEVKSPIEEVNLNGISTNSEFKAFISSTDMSLTKTSDKNSYYIGDQITYTIVITNNSSVNATNVILIDRIPMNSSLIKDSLIVNGASVLGNTLPINGINIGTIIPTNSITVSYKVKFYDVPFNSPVQVIPTINFNFTVNGIPTSYSFTGTCTPITINTDPIGLVQLFANKTVAISGDTVLYSLILKNNGSKTATNVKIMDSLPFGMSFVSNSLIVNGVSTPGDLTAGVIIPNINPNSQTLVTFEVKVN